MDAEKCKRLQAAGWAIGITSDFLGLTPAEVELVEQKVKLALVKTRQVNINSDVKNDRT